MITWFLIATHGMCTAPYVLSNDRTTSTPASYYCATVPDYSEESAQAAVAAFCEDRYGVAYDMTRPDGAFFGGNEVEIFGVCGQWQDDTGGG